MLAHLPTGHSLTMEILVYSQRLAVNITSQNFVEIRNAELKFQRV